MMNFGDHSFRNESHPSERPLAGIRCERDAGFGLAYQQAERSVAGRLVKIPLHFCLRVVTGGNAVCVVPDDGDQRFTREFHGSLETPSSAA